MFFKSADLDLSGKKILIRVDFNVPLKNGEVEDDARIRASLPIIEQCLEADAQVMLMSHLGRPKEGEFDEAFSLAPVARSLSSLLGQNVSLVKDWAESSDIGDAPITMFENVRFAVGEKANDDDLARKMAAFCDVFINDAFATAHRAQASTNGVAKYAPRACAGPLLVAEIEALTTAMEDPDRPMVAIVGGSKVSSKLTILESLLQKVDKLIVGGGIANTFLKAAGHNIGKSLCEEELLDQAKQLLANTKSEGGEIPLPVDVACAKSFSEEAEATIKNISDVDDDDLILDVGPETQKLFNEILLNAKTIVWNGPLGVFEFDQFSQGTRALGQSIAASEAFSIAGGGDTLSAINKFNLSKNISYISTGGGAFLEFIEGKQLPAIDILEESARAWEAMERAREY